jgi:Tfp pilus assembly PilM family ATPase
MVITKKIIVPAGQSEEELELQVEAEANQYIPFALDEVNLDFQVIGPAPNSPDVWNGTNFAVQSTVTRDSPATSMSTISVAVTWTQRGQNYAYNLQTIYADTRT